MQKNLLLFSFLLAFCMGRAQQPISAASPRKSADAIQHSDCPGCWEADSLGNHRAVVRFDGPGKIARVVIPWRRRDLHPDTRKIILQDAKTGKLILNKMAANVTRESGELFFEPVSGKGNYNVYYLPYRNEGRSNYPKGIYLKADTTASAEWLEKAKAAAANETHAGRKDGQFPGRTLTGSNRPGRTDVAINCTVIALQSIDSFNSFYPMEEIATAKETAALKKRYTFEPFLVFPEDRLHSIRMQHDLPYRWIQQDAAMLVSQERPAAPVAPARTTTRSQVPAAAHSLTRTGAPIASGLAVPSIEGAADRGEYYAYQLGVYALKPLDEIAVTFSDLQTSDGKKIAANHITCINTAGIDYEGKPFTKKVSVPEGQVQALWCGIDVPMETLPGTYTGTVTIDAKSSKPQEVDTNSSKPQRIGDKGFAPQTLAIRLTVGADLLKEHEAGDPAKMTRLKWLNSTLAQENTVIAPYTPLTIQGDTLIGLLGRKIQLNQQGFPEQIQTFFTPEMTDMTAVPNNLLAENIHFHFIRQSDGKDIPLRQGGLHFTLRSPGTVQWTAASISEEMEMDVSASLEFDGFLSYTVKVTALQDLALKDITMHIPFEKEAARYMMGLGQKGGYRPDSLYQWKWDVAHKNQDGAWIGAVNAGLQYSLRDEKYVRPLNTNFYLQKPLLLPSSWGNEGKGGIAIGAKGRSILANNYSGARMLKKGEPLYYNFNLLITPFHALNTDFQWAIRFYHKYNDLDTIKAAGATVVNIHHATPINPWINYPFIEWKKMKDYIDQAHTLGLKVKIYNTIRELSDHAYETFALRSLGNEIYSRGPGGGFSWLQEHIGEDYIAAWFVPEIKDAALVNSGMSRWHNYYVEGMNWLTQQVGIDGIYLDDVAFDRVTMKRIKRVLTQDGHPGIIDLHSANQYNPRDGFNNSANLYMEHFPYLNRLWFGEYFDYEKNPADFFLTEVSGIPFGLMGEMLEGGGNPWRGLLYGMTNRMPWTENADPRPIWKVWDDFGMQGTKMFGYWSPSCPVRTDQEKVLATVYEKKGALLVSLASWADQDTTVRLKIDWEKAGIDSTRATIEAPAMENFQPHRFFRPGEPIPVPKGKGWLLVVKQ